MQVHRHPHRLSPFEKSVVTIGTFDGVHRGHQKIIQSLKAEAARVGGQSVLVTFDPHPRKIVNPHASLQLINTLDEKMELLAAHGLDHLVVVPFTTAFAQQTAETYIEHFLVKTFQPHTVIIGYDHHFGQGRQGNFSLLEEKALLFKYKLIEIPKHLLNEIAVSSTKIRAALLTSDIDTANHLLGYPFFFNGIVVPGDQLGRTIGYPTANIEYTDSDKIRLGHGVFAASATLGGKTFNGMLSIGNRPTLRHSDEKIEINLFDFDRDIYGQPLRLTVHKYLRPQEKYPSLDALKAQLAVDKARSLQALS